MKYSSKRREREGIIDAYSHAAPRGKSWRDGKKKKGRRPSLDKHTRAALFTHLECHQFVVDHNLFRQEVRADGGLVLSGEALVHILVHKRGLSDAKRAKRGGDRGDMRKHRKG